MFWKNASAAALLVCLATSAQATTTTTFVFYETSCTTGGFGLNGICFSQPTQPLAIATMTISEETGTAIFSNPEFFGGPGPYSVPVVSDPLFSFTNFDRFGGVVIEPPSFTGARSYNISWTASDDELIAVSILSSGTNTVTNLGLISGVIGSDASLGTCRNGTCMVTGFWQDIAVPEPGTAILFLSAISCFGLVRRNAKSRRAGKHII